MPEFRRQGEGFLILGYTHEANEVFKRSNEIMDNYIKQSIKSLEEGEYSLQFDHCRGQSFRWMCENAFGCVGWFMDIVRNEKLTQLAISQNKAASKRYVESIEEGLK